MAETPEKPNKGFFWKLFFSVSGVFLCLFLLFTWYLHHRKYVWTNDAYLDGYQVQISADIQARITDLYVDEGDFVEKGKLLCRLDESILNTKKEDAKTRVDLLQEKLNKQKIERDKLHDIYQVAKQEFVNQIISYLDFDQIEKDYLASEAGLKVAEAALKNGIAQLEVTEELLRHTFIYAPRNGAIAKRFVVAGDVAQIGEPLFSLTDVENIWVTANLEETKVGHLKPGDQVDIQIDAYPDRTFTGSVFMVRAAAASQFSLIPPDNATGNFTKVIQRVPVKIWLDVPKTNTPLYLYPGMSVEISVQVR